jgi:L-rhamnonate dehydratase
VTAICSVLTLAEFFRPGRYALLGGKTKDRLPVYCTSARPEISKELGFCGAKVPCPYGPSAGDEGFRKNVAIFKEYREKVEPRSHPILSCSQIVLHYAVSRCGSFFVLSGSSAVCSFVQVGPDYPLALDCYMSLSVPYAIKLAKALEPYGLKWIEEALPPVSLNPTYSDW